MSARGGPLIRRGERGRRPWVHYASDATPNVAPRIRRYELEPYRVPTRLQTAGDSLTHAGRSPQDDAPHGIV